MIIVVRSAARQGTGQAQRRQKPHGVARTCVQIYLAKQYEVSE